MAGRDRISSFEVCVEAMEQANNTGIVAVGSDHAGYSLKCRLVKELKRLGYQVTDVGTGSEESCDYPDFALKVARMVSEGECARGVLVCGTGAGMAMVANKLPGVRAAACNETYTARYCRLHNDANILTMGARVIEPETALEIARVFMETGYQGDSEEGLRHRRRLEKLLEIERRYLR